VKVSPNAPICNSFANLGYCEAGADCPNRHEYECPDYTASGRCTNPKCRLPHVDRAGQLRQLENHTQISDSTDVNTIGNSNPILDSLDAALHSTDPISTEAETYGSLSDTDPSSPRPISKSTFTQEHNFLSLDDGTDGVFEKKFQSDE
jgi:hypothetical protein